MYFREITSSGPQIASPLVFLGESQMKSFKSQIQSRESQHAFEKYKVKPINRKSNDLVCPYEAIRQ